MKSGILITGRLSFWQETGCEGALGRTGKMPVLHDLKNIGVGQASRLPSKILATRRAIGCCTWERGNITGLNFSAFPLHFSAALCPPKPHTQPWLSDTRQLPHPDFRSAHTLLPITARLGEHLPSLTFHKSRRRLAAN